MGDIDAGLARELRVERLPSYYFQLPRHDRRRQLILGEFLPRCDVLVVAPRGPVWDVLESFQMRDSLGLDLPIVYLPLGELPRGALYLRAILGRLRAGDRIVFSCRADQAIFHRLVAQCRAATAVVPFGVDTEHFRPRPAEETASVRAHLGVEAGDLMLTYVGRVFAEKNVHTLVGVFGELSRIHPHLKLLIVGEVADERMRNFGTGPVDMAKCLYDSAGGEMSNIIQLGQLPRDELPRVLSASDLFVNLTTHLGENFCYSNVEAMSCGLPVLGVSWGGPKDTIAHGTTGLLAPALITPKGIRVDRCRLLDNCRRLIESAERRARMGAAARRRVLERYRLESFQARMREQVARSLAPRRRGGRTNAWTPLGRRFVEAWGGGENAGGARYSFTSRYDLFERLIEPYALGRSRRTPGRTDVLSLVSRLVDVEGRRVRVYDPLWPFETAPVTGTMRAIVERLLARPCIEYEALAVELKTSRGEVRSAVRRLMDEGIVVSTPVGRVR